MPTSSITNQQPRLSSNRSQQKQQQQSSTRQQQQQQKSLLLRKEEEYLLRSNAELEAKTATIMYEADRVLLVDSLRKQQDQHKSIVEAPTNQNEYQQTIDNLEKKLIDLNNNVASNSIKKSNLLRNIEFGGNHDDIESNFEVSSNIIPKQASEMSNDAQIRLLKAKLRVMQEEIERLTGELQRKDDENIKLVQRCNDLDEEKQRNQRQINTNQTQIDKYKKQMEQSEQKITTLEVQLQSLKKDNEQFKKEIRKQQQDQIQIELRLNRALEETDKYKQQLSKIQNNSKDTNDSDKKRLEQLVNDNKRLEKQKLELIQAFKKQIKLIDVLKKQKMHLEAAKMLQFSEDEFIKTLESNSSSNTNTDSGYELINANE